MSTWADLEREAPQIAEAGLRLMGEDTSVATVSDHGRLCVYPFRPTVFQGRLCAFVSERSARRRELAVIGCFAIHAVAGLQNEEFDLTGSIAVVNGRVARERGLVVMQEADTDDRRVLCEFELERALWTAWENSEESGIVSVHRAWS